MRPGQFMKLRDIPVGIDVGGRGRKQEEGCDDGKCARAEWKETPDERSGAKTVNKLLSLQRRLGFMRLHCLWTLSSHPSFVRRWACTKVSRFLSAPGYLPHPSFSFMALFLVHGVVDDPSFVNRTFLDPLARTLSHLDPPHPRGLS